MKRIRIMLLLSIIVIFIFVPVIVIGEVAYVGPEKCSECHQAYYDSWKRTWHSKVLSPAEEAKSAGVHEPPAPSTWNDVSYIIGGKHRVLYVNKSGYFITDSSGKPGSNQWNVETGRWADYEAGKTKQFDCAPCHTTGYISESHQQNITGINGTWVFNGITCERCHGPGSKHVLSANKSDIQRVNFAELCGQCHMVDGRENIPARDGLIQYHEEFNAWLVSPHEDAGIRCPTCHDSHEIPGVGHVPKVKECKTCHSRAEKEYNGTEMEKANVKCYDCHMPKAARSAEGNASRYYGDLRVHFFKISTLLDANMTYKENGQEFATGKIPLGWACLTPECHANKTVEWALASTKSRHVFNEPPAPAPAKQASKPESKSSPSFEALVAITGLLATTAMMKRRRL